MCNVNNRKQWRKISPFINRDWSIALFCFIYKICFIFSVYNGNFNKGKDQIFNPQMNQLIIEMNRWIGCNPQTLLLNRWPNEFIKESLLTYPLKTHLHTILYAPVQAKLYIWVLLITKLVPVIANKISSLLSWDNQYMVEKTI